MIERSNFAVYIEGEKIPFTSANVSLRGNNYTTASISMPSSFDAESIKRFSMVQVYYYDPYVADSEGKVRYNPSSGNWFLLWEGVVIGSNYAKTSSATNYSIICADYMVYLAGTKGILFNWRAWDPSYNTKRIAIGQKDLKVDPAGLTNAHWVDRFFKTDSPDIPDHLEGSSSESMVNLCLGFLNNWSDSMPLMKFHMDRLRFSKKLNSIEDDRITAIFNAQKMASFVEPQARSLSGESALIDLLNRMLSVTMYNYINVGPPVYGDKTLGNFILKPDTYFSIPPACNMIFPDQVVTMNAEHDFLNETTRARLPQKMGLWNKGWSMNYVAPVELGNKLDLYPDSEKPSPARILGTNSPDGNVIKDKQLYLDEEIEGLINLATISFDSKLNNIDTDKESTYNERMAILVDYLYKVNKYGSTPQSLSMRFSPQLAPMFSAIVLDRHSPVMGYITDVTHTINSKGHCGTHANIAMIRRLRFNKDKPLDPEESTQDVEPPQFLASAFTDRSKINGTYEKLLGCKSIKKTGTIKNIAISANEIFSLSGKSEGEYYEQVKKKSAHEYINGFTKRKVATINDVKRHYGLRVNDEGSPLVESMEHVEGDNPFEYRDFALEHSPTGTTDIGKEHKKKTVKQIREKYKGIIDGR